MTAAALLIVVRNLRAARAAAETRTTIILKATINIPAVQVIVGVHQVVIAAVHRAAVKMTIMVTITNMVPHLTGAVRTTIAVEEVLPIIRKAPINTAAAMITNAVAEVHHVAAATGMKAAIRSATVITMDITRIVMIMKMMRAEASGGMKKISTGVTATGV